MSDPLPPCEATRYKSGPCENDGARYVVEYRSASDHSLLDSHAACFRHGIAEVERHYASGGIAKCELTGPINQTYRAWAPPTEGEK